MSTGAFRMDDALGNALTVKVGKLVNEVEVGNGAGLEGAGDCDLAPQAYSLLAYVLNKFYSHGTILTGGDRRLVIVDGVTVACGEDVGHVVEMCRSVREQTS